MFDEWPSITSSKWYPVLKCFDFGYRWGILHEKSYQDILQSLFPMIHVVCVAHQLHNAAETARKSFPDVDALVFEIEEKF